MIPTTLQQIYDAKRNRRKALAALSIDERVAIIEKLHEFGLLMRKSRADHARKMGLKSSFEKPI